MMLGNSWTGSLIVPLASSLLCSICFFLFVPPILLSTLPFPFHLFSTPPPPSPPLSMGFLQLLSLSASPSVYLPSALAAVRFGLFSLRPPPHFPSRPPLSPAQITDLSALQPEEIGTREQQRQRLPSRVWQRLVSCFFPPSSSLSWIVFGEIKNHFWLNLSTDAGAQPPELVLQHFFLNLHCDFNGGCFDSH